MSQISDIIRKRVEDPDVTPGHYGSWGILRRDQRRDIRALCDACDMYERTADEFFITINKMWIPVAASLPEPDRFVLGVVNGTHGGITFKNALQLVEYDGRHWYLDGYPKIGAVRVSHWMPLPPLPKEVQEQ